MTSRAHRAVATFTVAAWDEQILTDVDGAGAERGGVYYPAVGITVTRTTYTYTGDIEGTGTGAGVMTYRKGAAPYAGFERVEGSVGGHDGSFVLAQTGEHDETGVRATMTVLEGMGTGGLETLRGEATIDLSGHSDTGYSIVLDYDL